MVATVTRASGDTPRSEDATRRYLSQEGLSAYEWSNAPGDTYAAHSHPYAKVIYVLRGSITFRLVDEGRDLALFTGDRLDLPPQIRHSAIVGPEGVTCLEAHKAVDELNSRG